jgi:Cys-tRNA synthase (O-phospho-L-seryl-tRNA:Cys-tRNA synthase)
MAKKKKKEDELKKAGEHLVRATTEGILGVEYAVKGLRNLLRESEGKELFFNLTGRFIGLGLGFMASLPEIVKQVREYKSESTDRSRKKSRKIKID